MFGKILFFQQIEWIIQENNMGINQELINKYKNDKLIIKTYYQAKDRNGMLVNIDSIVNPLKIDNRQLMAPTDNQHNVPSCAGFSACTLIESLYWKLTGKLIQLDANQVYAKAKTIDGSPNEEGTYLEYSLQAALSLSNFDFLKDAKIELFYNDKTNNTIELTKFLLHKYDFLQVGFMIDEAWYDGNNNNYVLKKYGRSLGGHAVNLCGFDQQGFYIQNQWGKNWCAKGFAIIPFDIFLEEFMYGAFIKL